MARDEFAVGGLRLRLDGPRLSIESTIENAGLSDREARALAESYAEALRRNIPTVARLRTGQEMAKMPPRLVTPITPTRPLDPSQLSRGLCLSRNELLSSEPLQLRQCYDYLQSAREHEGPALFSLYKLVETVENYFGGEANAIAILGAKTEIKYIKPIANENQRDQRHAPIGVATQPVQLEERATAFRYACQIMRLFEKYLASEPGRGNA